MIEITVKVDFLSSYDLYRCQVETLLMIWSFHKSSLSADRRPNMNFRLLTSLARSDIIAGAAWNSLDALTSPWRSKDRSKMVARSRLADSQYTVVGVIIILRQEHTG